MEKLSVNRAKRSSLAAYLLLLGVATSYVGYESATHSDNDPVCAHPEPLQKVSFKSVPGSNFAGPVEVTNEGHCVAIYDRASLKTVATIATGESFDVTCVTSKPNAFQVSVDDGINGYANYANSFEVTNSPGYNHQLIPGC